MAKEFSTILFTGAGFTYNFGGFLADQMWALIFSHPLVQKRDRVRNIMLKDKFFDYESIHESILFGPSREPYSDEDKEAIRTAVFQAYKYLDDIVRLKYENHSFTTFINELFKDRGLSFWFTTNQDLLVERCFLNLEKKLVLLGVPVDLSKLSSKKGSLKEDDYLVLPNKEKMEDVKQLSLSNSNLYYIKLHGSTIWKSSRGSNALVIGINKENQINSEPILKWYLDFFKEVLAHENKKLLVIGYGFRDEHINERISECIDKFNLKLYVFSPESPRDFKEKIYMQGYGNILYSGLSGYFQYKLFDIFPPSKKTSDHPAVEKILSSLRSEI